MKTTNPEIVRCVSMTECHAAACGTLEQGISAAIAGQGYCTIALSGGKTPAGLLQMLCRPPFLTRIDWGRVFFFFGDERFVPPDHPESNFGMARENLLAHLPVTAEQVYRMPVEIRPYAAAARCYQETMAEAFLSLTGREHPFAEGEYPCFDLILLGMGGDGHTASLFPGHPALARTDWVAEVEDADGAVPPVPRLTLTLPVINHADTVLFLVGGADKIRLADSFFSGPPQPRYPASLVNPGRRLCWFLAD